MVNELSILPVCVEGIAARVDGEYATIYTSLMSYMVKPERIEGGELKVRGAFCRCVSWGALALTFGMMVVVCLEKKGMRDSSP